ncbi:hypothetical protein Ctaglu_37580 [Clostridium tagluense]|uniref:Uncharacterized protein n=1 Tax=Clostridium tagluense TaxID=360422 RepID=A0A401URH5_9CLOT|nr:hypothetical protein Ctaglu_37580 [Clostridium tagluense]
MAIICICIYIMNNMIDLVIPILFLLSALSFISKWYKNRNKTDINLLLYDKNKYEIVNEKNF